ncbi:SSI family serine proteinase inhibitor [Blastococcus colisei]|nr:SSI family serine proteinase inhibitor [Blastococcus colisei]
MRRSLVLALASMALLGACASPSGDDGATGPTASSAPTVGAGDAAAGGGISQADYDLQVTVDRGDGTPPEEWTLTCVGFVEGSHPEAEAACTHLTSLEDPFAPLPEDVFCTQQFGGPQTAHVIGRWGGEPVDVQLSRTNGCLISQWDSLGPLLPVPVG